MNHVNSDQIRFLSDTEAAEVQYAPYEVRSQLINDSPFPIRVATRAGLKFVLEPRFNPKATLHELKAQITTGISSDVQSQLIRMFNNTGNADRRDILEKAMQVWNMWTRLRPRPLQVEHVISHRLFQASGNTIYLKELDYAFSMDMNDADFCHPYSVEAGLKNMMSTYDDTADDQYFFNICIVDNAEKIGPRWIKDCRGVCKIEPVKSDKSDGFYIVRTSSATTGLQKGTLTPEYHESETTLEGVRLYTSWAEAFNSDSADQAEAVANELRAKLQQSSNTLDRAMLEHESLKITAQQAREKFEHDRVKLQHDKDVLIAEAKALKKKTDREREKHRNEREKIERDYLHARAQHDDVMERLRAEQEKARQADRLDAATQTRRTVLDILKLVASLVSGVFSILLFMQKTKKA